MKRSRGYLRRSLAINTPRTSTVNGVSIDTEPPSDIEKDLLHGFRYRAVGTRTNVQQQIAVLADDVDELIDDELT